MILDRQVDLATPLHHTWTYQALAHDVLQYSLNRVSITEGDQGKMLNVHFCQKVLMFLSNRGIFYFPELENLNFGDFQDQMRPSCL